MNQPMVRSFFIVKEIYRLKLNRWWYGKIWEILIRVCKSNTITKVVYQKGQFEGTKGKLFNGPANNTEKKLAKACIDYWRGSPAKRALFFKNPGSGKSCPNRFFGKYAGRYKKHCFYDSDTPEKCGI